MAENTRYLFRGMSLSLIIRLAGVGLVFLGNVLLARALSTSDYGLFAYIIEVAALGSVVALLGFDQIAIKIVPALTAEGSRSSLLRFVGMGLGVTAVTTSVLSGLLWIARDSGAMPPTMTRSLLLACFFLLLSLACLRLLQECLRARRQIVLSQIVEQLVWPMVLVAGAATALLIGGAGFLPVILGLQILIFAVGAALLFVVFSRLPLTAPANEESSADPAHMAGWLKIGVPLAAAAAISVFLNRGDILALGATQTTTELAPYVAASRYAALLVLGLGAASAASAAVLSEQWHRGNFAELQQTIDRTVGLSTLFALPLAAIFLLVPAWPLALYGAAYSEGGGVLRILCLAQLLNVATGPVATLVIVCEQVRLYTLAMFAAAVLMGTLLFLLIPLAGNLGAAAAVLISLSTFNIGLAWLFHKRTGLRPWVTGIVLIRSGKELAAIFGKAVGHRHATRS